ncbi:MAG: HK97 gp10 family phage protein [Magnetococcales bacterium]|nr:HK97 gp10 family phage protein [Magnetococcales bacterium]
MEATFKLSGLEGARKVLQKLPERVQKRVVTAATRSQAVAVRAEVRNAAPTGDGEKSKASKTYGSLKSNIRLLKLKKMPRGSVGYRIDLGPSAKRSFWGYFHEYGTGRFSVAPGGRSKRGKSKVHMRPRPWFRPAVNRAAPRANQKLQQSMVRGIEREAGKLAGKYSIAKKSLR